MKRFILFALMAALPLLADLKTAPIFSSDMVLQRNSFLPVWGTAAPGATIQLTFAGQKVSTKADAKGNWEVSLSPLAQNSQPEIMVISDGNQTLTLKNILVGDVWICCGQSNMEMPFAWGVLDTERFLKEAETLTQIRYTKVPHLFTPLPQSSAPYCPWQTPAIERTRQWSACGYFFARRIFLETGIPIGLVDNSWSGSRIEAYIPPEGIKAVPELQEAFTDFNYIFSNGKVEPPRKFEHDDYMQKYNAMVAPITRFPVKGVIWYQGCANAGEPIPVYMAKMKALISGWRSAWNRLLPFYYVQLASLQISGQDTLAGGNGFSNCREAQRRILELPHTGMATTIDIGMASNIHPVNKYDVGERLARWALRNDYERQETVVSGPLFRSIDIQSNCARLTFDYADGLTTANKEGMDAPVPNHDAPRHFLIAGSDNVWFPADASIEGNTVTVSSPCVPHPKAVRYAFRGFPKNTNMYNAAGLPMVPFTTETVPQNISIWQTLTNYPQSLFRLEADGLESLKKQFAHATFIRSNQPECPLTTDNPQVKISIAQNTDGTFAAFTSHAAIPNLEKKSCAMAPRIGKAPVIDGELNDAAWLHACELNNFKYINSDTVERVFQPTVWMTFDQDNLYLGFYCPGSNPLALSSGHDKACWLDDAVEFYIGNAKKTDEYVQVIFSPSGAYYDGNKSKGKAYTIDHLKHAAKIKPTHWIVEASIPWKEIGVTPEQLKKGSALTMNFARDYQVGNSGNATWSPVKDNYQNTAEFGNVIIADTSSRDEIEPEQLTVSPTVPFHLVFKNKPPQNLRMLRNIPLSDPIPIQPNAMLELPQNSGMILLGTW